jgi:hypothetical protein
MSIFFSDTPTQFASCRRVVGLVAVAGLMISGCGSSDLSDAVVNRDGDDVADSPAVPSTVPTSLAPASTTASTAPAKPVWLESNAVTRASNAPCSSQELASLPVVDARFNWLGVSSTVTSADWFDDCEAFAPADGQRFFGLTLTFPNDAQDSATATLVADGRRIPLPWTPPRAGEMGEFVASVPANVRTLQLEYATKGARGLFDLFESTPLEPFPSLLYRWPGARSATSPGAVIEAPISYSTYNDTCSETDRTARVTVSDFLLSGFRPLNGQHTSYEIATGGSAILTFGTSSIAVGDPTTGWFTVVLPDGQVLVPEVLSVEGGRFANASFVVEVPDDMAAATLRLTTPNNKWSYGNSQCVRFSGELIDVPIGF